MPGRSHLHRLGQNTGKQATERRAEGGVILERKSARKRASAAQKRNLSNSKRSRESSWYSQVRADRDNLPLHCMPARLQLLRTKCLVVSGLSGQLRYANAFLKKFSVIHNALRRVFVVIAKTELESRCTDV